MPQRTAHASTRQQRPAKVVGAFAALTLAVTGCSAQALPDRVGATEDSVIARPVAAATPRAVAVQSCASLAASLSRREQIGQLMMVGIDSRGMTSSQARLLAQHHVGSVILLGNTTAGSRAIKALSKKVHGLGGKPRGVAIMLTVDQEGGQVQRLRGTGFDRIPSARSQAKLSSKELQKRSKRWGEQLRAAGVDANLSPVADVVPKSMERVNRPIGLLQRGYGPDPSVVAAKVPAFVRGMSSAGVVTAVKHYPGLGRVRGNTDYEPHVVDSTTTRRDRGLKGFAAGAEAGVDMVMMSSAYYSKIDKKHRAVFSRTIMVQMLRKDLKFTGVIISDDLAARAVSDYSVGRRATTFLGAGGDLIIVGNPALAPTMISAISAKASADAGFRTALQGKATRVLRMKARHGLVKCG